MSNIHFLNKKRVPLFSRVVKLKKLILDSKIIICVFINMRTKLISKNHINLISKYHINLIVAKDFRYIYHYILFEYDCY